MRYLMIFLVLTMAMALTGEWTVIETYIVPEGAAGLAWDGEYLYCGIYGVNGDEFYQIDPNDGSWENIFTVADLGDCFGLTYDGEHLWTTDHPSPSSNPAIAMELDMDGNVVSQFNLPDHYMSGICYDNGDFWVSTYYDPDGFIYKLDDAGNILQSFAAPDNQPWDLCLENELLWMADYWGDALYKIDPIAGSLIESHASEGVDPSGIVYDGEYLWYCDNGQGAGQDYLYKVDIGETASGTISGYVYDNAMQPLEGVEISINDLIVITDAEGYFMVQVLPGDYTVAAFMAGYYISTLEVTVFAGETIEVEIILQPEEELLPPQDVTADEGGYISWTAPPGALFFNIYWDNNLMGQTEETSFQMTGLEFNHYYELGISAVYEMAESDIVTVCFIYTGYHQFGDIDDNDLVEAYDAAIALQYVVGLDPVAAPLPWEDWRIAVADVDGNSTVEAYDSALILQYVVGIIETFPADLPLRESAPQAKIDIKVEDDCLVFSSKHDLYAFTLQVEGEHNSLSQPVINNKDLVTAFNSEIYTLAIASAQPINGDFLTIPFDNTQIDLCLSLVINTQKSSRRVYLEPTPQISSLKTNYPNPFNPETTISLQIAADETGELSIFNVKGQKLVTKEFSSGEHIYRWQVNDYCSGIYFYRLTTESVIKTRKMLLIK